MFPAIPLNAGSTTTLWDWDMLGIEVDEEEVRVARGENGCESSVTPCCTDCLSYQPLSRIWCVISPLIMPLQLSFQVHTKVSYFPTQNRLVSICLCPLTCTSVNVWINSFTARKSEKDNLQILSNIPLPIFLECLFSRKDFLVLKHFTSFDLSLPRWSNETGHLMRSGLQRRHHILVISRLNNTISISNYMHALWCISFVLDLVCS